MSPILQSKQNGTNILEQLIEIEARLRAERQELYRVFAAAGSLPTDELIDGWQERDSAAEHELRYVEYGNRELFRHRLYQIDLALHRLRDGTYGYCLECGCQINPKRLTANPAASLCLICQNAAEDTV